MKLPHEWVTRPVAGQRTSAVAYVLQDVREAITSGVIAVGEQLPSESAMAARYSVSRAVIREVLRSLESTGLTVTRTGRGTFVVSSHPAERIFEGYPAVHLIEARPAVEVPAAGLAARRRTDAQLAELQDLARRMEGEHDPAHWTQLDAAFHLTIAQASGNPVFTEILSSIAAALRGQSHLPEVTPDRRAASLDEHRAILLAIASWAVGPAEDAMRVHLSEVRDALAVSLTGIPGSPS